MNTNRPGSNPNKHCKAISVLLETGLRKMYEVGPNMGDFIWQAKFVKERKECTALLFIRFLPFS